MGCFYKSDIFSCIFFHFFIYVFVLNIFLYAFLYIHFYIHSYMSIWKGRLRLHPSFASYFFLLTKISNSKSFFYANILTYFFYFTNCNYNMLKQLQNWIKIYLINYKIYFAYTYLFRLVFMFVSRNANNVSECPFLTENLSVNKNEKRNIISFFDWEKQNWDLINFVKVT